MSEEATEVNEETETSPSWLDGIDPQFREDPSVSKHENVTSLIQEHINAQSMLGRKGIIKPQEGDGDDVYAAYRDALGVPKAADEYSVDAELTDDWDHNFGAKIAKIAHENNVSNEAFNAIVKEYNDWAREAVGDPSRVQEERLSELKKELGTKYEAVTGLGSAALTNLADSPSDIANIKLADGTLLGNNPDFIKVMGKAGEMMQEKGMIGDKPVNPHGMTPDEAKAALDNFEADTEKFNIVFYEPNHPAHATLVAERDRLLSMAYPEE